MSANSAPAITNRRCMSERMYAISCARLKVKVGIGTPPPRRDRGERASTGPVPAAAIFTSVSAVGTGGTTVDPARLEGRAGPRCRRRGPTPPDGALRLVSLNDGPPFRLGGRRTSAQCSARRTRHHQRAARLALSSDRGDPAGARPRRLPAQLWGVTGSTPSPPR